MARPASYSSIYSEADSNPSSTSASPSSPVTGALGVESSESSGALILRSLCGRRAATSTLGQLLGLLPRQAHPGPGKVGTSTVLAPGHPVWARVTPPGLASLNRAPMAAVLCLSSQRENPGTADVQRGPMCPYASRRVCMCNWFSLSCYIRRLEGYGSSAKAIAGVFLFLQLLLILLPVHEASWFVVLYCHPATCCPGGRGGWR